ncbi:hypothetical protein [Streptomyces sp. SPB074]|uniref:hypothetical protein n=1 Tax=Streptomyces sp. (strain SPB074) TaxID=465543 RepID=UPI0001D1E35B|nr:hypothetical protein [Streptomyces sp. SPB074]EFG64496.1 hypothetical protein SSBG_05282 [Streptomyces sp. SPB074]
MLFVACLLLPLAAVLLFAMDRVEDWMGSSAGSSPGRRRTRRERSVPETAHRTRHLRVVRDTDVAPAAADARGTAGRERAEERRAA